MGSADGKNNTENGLEHKLEALYTKLFGEKKLYEGTVALLLYENTILQKRVELIEKEIKKINKKLSGLKK